MKVMIRKYILGAAISGVFAMATWSGLGASSLLVYDNSANDLTVDFAPGAGQAVGDQIILEPTVTPRELLSFDFQYFLPAGASRQVNARVVLAENDGAPDPNVAGALQPGTTLYDSGQFAVADAPSRATLVFDLTGLGVVVPDSFTWIVKFTGDRADEVALTLYSPPVVGDNYLDYWHNTSGSNWELRELQDVTGAPVPADFAARFYVVPEPTSIAFGVIFGGGALGLIIARRRAKKTA